MVDRSKNRSDQYQHKIVESACAPDILMEIAEAEGIGAQLNPFSYNEELLDLKDELKEHFWRMVREKLTPRQRQVIELYCEDYTQTEIAKKLGVNQSSITKSMNGNCDYKNGKKIYGGAKKKLSKIAETDPNIQEILRKMRDIESDSYY